MKKISTQNMYSDVLYWATSTQSKDNGYHITRTQEAILRKLIHYSRSNEKITYSNEIIAEHTFMGEETIRKAIPEIAKKGFISTAVSKIFDSGEFKTRRTIYIKWDFIESVLVDVPKKEDTSNVTTSTSTSLNENLTEIEILPIIDESDLNSKTNQAPVKSISNLIKSEIFEIPEIVITDEKFKWLREVSKIPTLTKEDVLEKGQEVLKQIFYNDTGIWKINNDSHENQYRIKLTHRGGSIGSLYDNSKNGEKLSINIYDFGYYLNQKGIKFDKFTPSMYKDIKAYGLIKKPLEYKEPCPLYN
jgi:hypothetical protein